MLNVLVLRLLNTFCKRSQNVPCCTNQIKTFAVRVAFTDGGLEERAAPQSIRCERTFRLSVSMTLNASVPVRLCAGVRPYQCDECSKAFTQRCSLESHCRKVHGREFHFAHKQRRDKVYVCEECGHTTGRPELHYAHLKHEHPSSPALLRAHDKRYFKFTAAAASPASNGSPSLPSWDAAPSLGLLPRNNLSYS